MDFMKTLFHMDTKESKKIFDFFENIFYSVISLALLAGQGPILSIFITPLLLSYSQHFDIAALEIQIEIFVIMEVLSPI